MDKKMYLEPTEEVIFLQMSSALLAGSIDEDGGEAADFPPGTEPYVDPNDD